MGDSLWKNVIAGGSAGAVEIAVMYSTDVAKTRQQLSTQSVGMIQTYKNIISSQGWLGLYRGVSAPILAEAPKRAWKFTANQEFKRIIAGWSPDSKLTVGGAALAGSLSGMSEAFVNCPFETVKVRMQAKENLTRFKSPRDCLSALLREEGVLALYNGLEPLILRNALWNGCYFGAIGLANLKFPLAEDRPKSVKLMYKFAVGTLGSMLGTICNTPMDVAKSRMQQQSRHGELKYRNTFQTLALIYREEGAGALYKGIVPRLVRLGPGGGIMIVAFDVISKFLEAL